eukprot:gene24475-20762_t
MVCFLQDSAAGVGSGEGPGPLMAVLLGRLLRCVRVAAALRPFRHIMKTFSNILPMFATYVTVSFLAFYVFAVLGMEVLGRTTPPPGTAYAEGGYYALNFGTFYHAVVTLLCLMVVSNWHVVADGYRAASGDGAIVFFVAFWLVAVILLVNIVSAFVIEVWGSQWELNKASATHVANHPLARRVLALNGGTDPLLHAPSPPGRPPAQWRVTYADYSHKVQLALEQIFLGQRGITHVLEGGGPGEALRTLVAFRRLREPAKLRVLQLAEQFGGGDAARFRGRKGEGKMQYFEQLPATPAANAFVTASPARVAGRAATLRCAPNMKSNGTGRCGSCRARAPRATWGISNPLPSRTVRVPGGSPPAAAATIMVRNGMLAAQDATGRHRASSGSASGDDGAAPPPPSVFHTTPAPPPAPASARPPPPSARAAGGTGAGDPAASAWAAWAGGRASTDARRRNGSAAERDALRP